MLGVVGVWAFVNKKQTNKQKQMHGVSNMSLARAYHCIFCAFCACRSFGNDYKVSTLGRWGGGGGGGGEAPVASWGFMPLKVEPRCIGLGDLFYQIAHLGNDYKVSAFRGGGGGGAVATWHFCLWMLSPGVFEIGDLFYQISHFLHFEPSVLMTWKKVLQERLQLGWKETLSLLK